MYRGFSAESPSTSRMRAMALCRLWSKSTKVPLGQIWLCSSSRVTTSPAFSSRILENLQGLAAEAKPYSLPAQQTGTDIQLEIVEAQPCGSQRLWARLAPLVGQTK